MKALLAGLAAAGIASRLLDKPEVITVAIGIVAALIVALATSTKLHLGEREIAYSSLFSHHVIPLREIAAVSVGSARGLIPGRAIGIMMKGGSQPTFTVIRVGLFSWPNLGKWISSAHNVIQRPQSGYDRGGGDVG
ncbi:MAG TPA: hypothetical protein VN229_10175 [Terriglobales bacterium]|nr:hypothetical protein [Terriglobales bacterium]